MNGQVKQIGTIRGFKYHELEALFERRVLKRNDVDSIHALLGLLKKQRVDAVVIDIQVATYVIAHSDNLAFNDFVVGGALSTIDFRVQCSNTLKFQQFLSTLNNRLKAISHSNELKTLKHRYCGRGNVE